MVATAALASAIAAAQTGKVVWNQNLQYAVYTSASVARHRTNTSGGTTPTFSAATWLNPPIYVEAYNVSDSGENIWNFQATSTQATFQVDMARHTDSIGVGAVDTVAAEANFVPPSSCNVYAFASTGARANGVPAWNFSVPECDVGLLYDQNLMVDFSDDGSTVAFAAYANGTYSGKIVTTARCYVFDGQTGRLRFTYDLGPTVAPSDGGVSVSDTGAWVAYTNGAQVYVLDGTNGKLRDLVNLNYGIAAVISATGDYLAAASPSDGFVYTWNAAQSQYLLNKTLTPGNGSWYPESLAISSFDTTANGELVSFGWIDDTALQARITIHSMVTGELLTDFYTVANAKLQTVPTVRSDRDFTGAIFWGDSGDVPTCMLFKAGSSKPVYGYITPGSMFGVDVVVDTITPTETTVFLVAAGKHVPANEFGNGGDAFAFEITVPA